jgi:SAM-dependent methyltransferase
MATKDKIKWDKKYQENSSLLKDRAISTKLEKIITQANVGVALDIACGVGRHSIYLAKLGFSVDAFDISQIAIDKLTQKNISNITTKTIDLEGFIPLVNHYDFIIMTNYLDRELIPYLARALKKDGLLFIETYMQHENNSKPMSNPSFMLQKEELKTFFDDKFEVLDYDEFDNEAYEMHTMRKQFIAVKKTKD